MRDIKAIEAEINQTAHQLGVATANYAFVHADQIAKLRTLDTELGEARAEVARNTPEALLARITELEAKVSK